MNPKLWVLVDNRVGNTNHALELAGKLGVKFEIKHIEYNSFAKLPSYLLNFSPIHIKKHILSKLKNEKIPDLIMSSGRRIAPLAVYLKRLSGNSSKIIQIMRPNLEPREFEMIILPQHDSFNYTLPNIVRIIGALTSIQDRLLNENKEFVKKYPDLNQFIATIIGGSTKNYKLTMRNAELLARILNKISGTHSLPIFITFSRRTPKNVKKYFIDNFSWPHIIYDPASGESNPYPAILGRAEYIISTTDSISMCSEATSFGKPVYVFCPANFKLKKHSFFIQQLVDLGMVRRLEATTNYLEKYEYEPLSEITKVAKIIKEKILSS